MSVQNETFIQNYAALFAELTPEKLTELENIVSDDIVFSDPFNLTHGRDKFISIFHHMYDVMKKPKFEILDLTYSDKSGYIKWRLTGHIRKWKSFSIDITGMSEIITDGDGKIIGHYDYWDSASQLFIFIPIVGTATRLLLKLFRNKKNYSKSVR